MLVNGPGEVARDVDVGVDGAERLTDTAPSLAVGSEFLCMEKLKVL